jgi:L-alanine-DL-glutamate epimerase-like enolase superfamily enzyme
MKITRVDVWSVPVVLETVYTVAYATCDRTTLVFLRVETDRGVTGFGSAGCDPEVTGETAEAVARTLREVAAPRLVGDNPLALPGLLRDLRRSFGRQPSALAAVDMALHDILGQVLGLPLWKLLGGVRDRIATSITIGILPLAETLECARRWVRDGFQALKLKGGLDVGSDVERVLRVREVVGGDVEIRFDANQGYSVADAVAFAEAVRPAGVTVFEQPTAADRPDLLGEVRRTADVPVMADESCLDATDAFALAAGRQVDMLNVKLMKSGGIAGALRIGAVAEAAGLQVMTGCMDESALGIAAGLHFTLACPAVTCADLDGHIGLTGDPAAGGLRLENGVLIAPERAGLGVAVTNP